VISAVGPVPASIGALKRDGEAGQQGPPSVVASLKLDLDHFGLPGRAVARVRPRVERFRSGAQFSVGA
jgi:hypothetical protein